MMKKFIVEYAFYIYCLMVVTVCMVAAYDIYCTVKLANTLKDFEQNPVAKMLIEFDNDTIFSYTNHPSGMQISTKIPVEKTNVANLIGFKVVGLLIAYTYFIFIYTRRPKIAYSTAIFMFVFQIMLLIRLLT